MTGRRQTDVHVEAARATLKTAIEKASHNPATRKELSHLIAKFTAQVVRADRVHRHPHDSLVKLVDVLFNGRPA